MTARRLYVILERGPMTIDEVAALCPGVSRQTLAARLGRGESSLRLLQQTTAQRMKASRALWNKSNQSLARAPRRG